MPVVIRSDAMSPSKAACHSWRAKRTSSNGLHSLHRAQIGLTALLAAIRLSTVVVHALVARMQVVMWSAEHERLGARLSYVHEFRFHVFTAVSDLRFIFRSAKRPNIMSGRFDSDSLARLKTQLCGLTALFIENSDHFPDLNTSRRFSWSRSDLRHVGKYL